MKITRETIIEAIRLGKDILPKFTAFEMARVIGVPVKHLLKAIQANLKNFKFDSEKNIIGLDNSSRIQNINSNEVWTWYLTNRLNGKSNACLTVSDQQRLMASLNSRIKWELNFGLVTATFASQEISGTDVRNRIVSDYSPTLAARLIKLGTVSGSGQVPDRYVFGIILTEEEISNRKIEHLPLYLPDWAMEEMMNEVDWVDVEVPDIYEVTTLPIPPGGTAGPSAPGEPSPPPSSQRQPSGGSTDTDQRVLAGAGGSKPPIPGAVQRARRTKEQIDADLKKMVDDLVSRSMFTQEEIDTVAKAEKISDAEKAYKGLIAKADAIEAKEREKSGLPGQQSFLKEDTAPSSTPPATPSLASTMVEIFKPAESQQTQQHVPPAINSAPASLPSSRPSMPRLSDLEGVSDIKASIRKDAGDVPPPPPVQTNPVTPPIHTTGQLALQPAPVVNNPPPAGASASAEDLLNSLLKQTGQVG